MLTNGLGGDLRLTIPNRPQLSHSSGLNALLPQEPFVPKPSSPTHPDSALLAKALQGARLPIPGLKFSGAIHKDYSVEIRGDVPLNPQTVFQAQQSMLLRDLCKADEKGSLKLFLGPFSATAYPQQDQSALADSLTYISRPVDVVISSAMSRDGIRALLSATGKRFINPGGIIQMGRHEAAHESGKNKDFQVNRELFNAYLRDLESLVMERTGTTDRQAVYQDLMSERHYNALQALFYGKKGLVDGILVEHDKVLTRKGLEEFYGSQKWDLVKNAAQIEAFNKDYLNIYKVTEQYAVPLKKFSKATVTDADQHTNYKSLAEIAQGTDLDLSGPGEEPGNESAEGTTTLESKGLTLNMNALLETDDGVYARIEKAEGSGPQKPVFYLLGAHGLTQTQSLALNYRVSGAPKIIQVEVTNAPQAARSILNDDVIFFNDPFTEETSEQIGEALLKLDDKKQTQTKPSHIKIVENSPGGSITSGQELRSVIRSLKTPVDVIVQGMGASCGSWLLCSATGNRFATPNARIMIHEAASSIPEAPAQSFNEAADFLQQATRDYVQIVADSSGRPFKDVWLDFKLDNWFNPLEALMYGEKGLIDGILVGPDKLITRKDLEGYLIEKLGSRAKMKKYVQDRLEAKREPKHSWRPEDHDASDPFDNPLKVIHHLQKSAGQLSDTERFSASLANLEDPDRSINYYTIVNSGMDDDDEGRTTAKRKQPLPGQRPFSYRSSSRL